MLRRKPKRRYITILHKGRDVEALQIIERRCAGLFGETTLEKANLRLLRSYPDVILVRCRLSQIHPVLMSVTLANPAMVTLDMSGSISRLKKRLGVENRS
jgi:RNase P/RNase MRP subunit POP5